MRFYKTGLLVLTCLLATPALAVEVSELAGYSRMTVSDEFKAFLEKDSALAKTLADDVNLSRLVMTRPVLQQQLMKKELSIKEIEASYFPNKNTKVAATAIASHDSDKDSAAKEIIAKAITAARAPAAQQRSQQQIAALDTKNPQALKDAQALAAAEMNAAASAPQAAAGYATYTPEVPQDTRNYTAIFEKLMAIINPRTAAWGVYIAASPAPHHQPMMGSSGQFGGEINQMRNGDDLKRVKSPSFFTLMERLMNPTPQPAVDRQQLLALLKAAANQPDDLALLLKNKRIQDILVAMKVNPATLFSGYVAPAEESVVTFITVQDAKRDNRGYPEHFYVHPSCPLPQGKVAIAAYVHSNAIYVTNDDPAAGLTIAHPLGNGNVNYALRNLTALSYLPFNNGLINEAVMSYCPGDFTGFTPEGYPEIEPLCLTSAPHYDKYSIGAWDKGRPSIRMNVDCLAPEQTADNERIPVRYLNIRAKDTTLPPYVGPCLDSAPYPVNYNSLTCGQKQTTASGTCDGNIRETFSCYDTKNELPPQAFTRSCNNGVWTWTEGYMNPASSRFRCEGVFTAASGKVTDYTAPDFSTWKLDMPHALNNPGDTVCAAHREGQIRRTVCGSYEYFDSGFNNAGLIHSSHAQQCQFDSATNTYNWQTVAMQGSFPHENLLGANVCHVSIDKSSPAACSITNTWHREANEAHYNDNGGSHISSYEYEGKSYHAISEVNTLQEGETIKMMPVMAGSSTYTDFDANNEPMQVTVPTQRVILKDGKPADADTLAATYQCLARGTAVNSNARMLPAFYPVNGTARRLTAFGNRALPLKVYTEADDKTKHR